jgi:glycosyltransferase involved in cell wall biosynthesis
VVQQLDEYDKDNPAEQHKNLNRINVNYDVMFSADRLVSELTSNGALYDYDVVFGSHAPVTPVLKHLSRLLYIPWGVMLLDIPTDLIMNEPARHRQWTYWFNVMSSASQVVFNTDIARDEFKRIVGVDFFDDNVVTYATKIPEEYKLSGMDIKGDYVVSACRLTPIKNISMITKALALVDRPIKQIVIGRDRGDLAKIKKIAEENKVEVIYKDMVSEKEKFELIRDSLCLAYPQNTEYIGGLSPWEGMMIGKPTVCTDFKVLKDLFKDNIDYFDKNSVQAFADKLTEIYDNVYAKEKLKRASEYAYEDASFKTMASKLIHVFKKMVGEE